MLNFIVVNKGCRFSWSTIIIIFFITIGVCVCVFVFWISIEKKGYIVMVKNFKYNFFFIMFLVGWDGICKLTKKNYIFFKYTRKTTTIYVFLITMMMMMMMSERELEKTERVFKTVQDISLSLNVYGLRMCFWKMFLFYFGFGVMDYYFYFKFRIVCFSPFLFF